MDADQISQLGQPLMAFLNEFDDCFGRSEPREHLRTCVCGQLSDLPRKSIEPIALEAGTPPRTLQRFFESVQWDELRLRDRLQWMVARDHAHPRAIGTIDESGHPKKGEHTAAVQHQWCGNTGKVDNCVVSVHAGYTVGDFQCLLDSDLYLPKDWANDPVRRREAYIPDDVVFRTKQEIALEQVKRALGNGIRVAAWTFDALYGRDNPFLDAMETLGQNYVAEVPSTFTGWLYEPQVLHRPTPQEMRKRGRKRRFPRLARKSLPACEVRNLVTYSPVFR
jgi:SRSO17 transposase